MTPCANGRLGLGSNRLLHDAGIVRCTIKLPPKIKERLEAAVLVLNQRHPAASFHFVGSVGQLVERAMSDRSAEELADLMDDSQPWQRDIFK
jgi:hypothetical protein